MYIQSHCFFVAILESIVLFAVCLSVKVKLNRLFLVERKPFENRHFVQVPHFVVQRFNRTKINKKLVAIFIFVNQIQKLLAANLLESLFSELFDIVDVVFSSLFY
jgi:hypothetical protein